MEGGWLGIKLVFMCFGACRSWREIGGRRAALLMARSCAQADQCIDHLGQQRPQPRQDLALSRCGISGGENQSNRSSPPRGSRYMTDLPRSRTRPRI